VNGGWTFSILEQAEKPTTLRWENVNKADACCHSIFTSEPATLILIEGRRNISNGKTKRYIIVHSAHQILLVAIVKS